MPSRNLRELQAAFAAALEDGNDKAVRGLIRPNGLEPGRRLDVYRNNSRLTQAEALSGIYPAISRLLGEEFFAHMAGLFWSIYPSRSGDLRRYGRELADFLAEFPPTCSLAYLPDVARLEWAWHEAFHAPFSAAPAPQAHARQPDARRRALRFALLPGASLLRSDFPVPQIWEFALAENEADTARLDLSDPRAAHTLVLRPQLEVLVLELEPAEWRWLQALNEGAALDAADELARSMDPGADSARYLRDHLQLGSFDSRPIIESPRGA